MTEDEKIEQLMVLAKGSTSPFWKLVKEFLEIAGNSDKMLAINNEMGMKGFWYMKGYIKAIKDVEKFVEAPAQKLSKKQVEAKKSLDKARVKAAKRIGKGSPKLMTV